MPAPLKFLECYGRARTERGKAILWRRFVWAQTEREIRLRRQGMVA